MKASVATVLIRCLKGAGVEHIFGVSAHSLFDVTDAIYQEGGIEFVPTQCELGASYMANAYAAGGRRLGVCLASAGAGITNTVTGVAEAWKESTPVLFLSSDVDRDVAGRGASPWHEIPQTELMRPLTKMSRTIERPDEAWPLINEAINTAQNGRKGPVYLGMPTDVQVAEVEAADPIYTPARAERTAPDPALIRRAADLLAGAAAPAIIAGGGVHWSGAMAELRQLASLLQAPVGMPHSQKGLLSDDDPLSLGVLGFGSFGFSARAIQEADVILAAGTTFSEGMTSGFGHRIIPERAAVIHIDLDPREIGKVYPAEIGIVADAKLAFEALLAEVRGRDGKHAQRAERLARIAADKQAWFEELARQGAADDGPIRHQQIYTTLEKVVPEDTIIVGAGCTNEILSKLRAKRPLYQSGDFRAIGHGLSSAIGMQYANPGKLVVCITGDGSFMMELQELATLARTGFPILTIVVHNSAYGNMKRDQMRHYDGRVIGTDLLIPELAELAGSFGIRGEKLTKPAELEPAMRRALDSGKATLLDVICPIEGL